MKTHKIVLNLVASFALLVCVAPLTVDTSGQTPSRKSRVDRRIVKANQLVPELYPDKLSLKVVLKDLPGARAAGSYWQVEYKIYFVAEQAFESTIKQLAKDGRNRELRPEYFPDKVLLAEGQFRKGKLGTLQERTFLRREIDFKQKIPGNQQTAYSGILNSYSIKLYDAKLKKSIYASDVLVVPPVNADLNDKSASAPDASLYLNFHVSDEGSLRTSNRKRDSETSEWNPN